MNPARARFHDAPPRAVVEVAADAPRDSQGADASAARQEAPGKRLSEAAPEKATRIDAVALLVKFGHAPT